MGLSLARTVVSKKTSCPGLNDAAPGPKASILLTQEPAKVSLAVVAGGTLPGRRRTRPGCIVVHRRRCLLGRIGQDSQCFENCVSWPCDWVREVFEDELRAETFEYCSAHDLNLRLLELKVPYAVL